MTHIRQSSIRIDFDIGVRLGPGKAQLLELIEEHGSIRAAGAAIGMSYRRAWLLADEINRMFVKQSIFTRHGGKSGGGAGLTEFGRELLSRYRRIEAVLRDAAQDDLTWLSAHIEAGFTPPDKRND